MNRRSRSVAALALGVAVAASGCSSISGTVRLPGAVWRNASGRSQFTADDLREELAGFSARYIATVVSVADEIASGTSDPEMRRRALLWKLRTTPVVNEAAFAEDPELGYIGIYSVAVALQQYLTVGAGADVFGPQQPPAVEASEDLLSAARGIGARFLDEGQQERLRAQVEEIARRHPIRGVFVAEIVPAAVSASEPGGSLRSVLGVPLAPFTALQGVDSGAQAIREFNVTASRFTRLVATLPQQLRWNLELYTFGLEERPGVESVRGSFETVARSSEAFVAAAQHLPAELREQFSGALAQLESGQGPLQKTLADARALVADAGNSGESLRPLAEALERTASQAQQAGVAWTALVAEVQKSPSGGAGARAFDITEYERTAAQLTAAAGEIRGMLADLRVLDPILDRVEGSGRGVVDLAAWRTLELMLAFFALLFLSRRIEALLSARRAAGPERS